MSLGALVDNSNVGIRIRCKKGRASKELLDFLNGKPKGKKLSTLAKTLCHKEGCHCETASINTNFLTKFGFNQGHS